MFVELFGKLTGREVRERETILISKSAIEFRCPSPHLHLTTSKVMVIVWRLRGNIIRTVLYIANVLPLQWAQLTTTVHTARLGLEFVFLCFFYVEWFVFMFMYVLFYLGQLSHFPSCFGAGETSLNEPPRVFAPSPLLRVGSWLHPF